MSEANEEAGEDSEALRASGRASGHSPRAEAETPQ